MIICNAPNLILLVYGDDPIIDPSLGAVDWLKKLSGYIEPELNYKDCSSEIKAFYEVVKLEADRIQSELI